MISKVEEIYNDGKKSLESLLREKAYSDVKKHLEGNGISIESVSDEDIENLVAAKVKDMLNGIRGFGVGTAFAIALSLLGV